MTTNENSQQNPIQGDAIEARIGDVSSGQVAVGKDITQIQAGRDVYSAETITIIYQSADVAPDTVREELSSEVCAHLLEGFLNPLEREGLPLETRAFVVDEGLKVVYHQGDRLNAPEVRPSDIKDLRDQIQNDLEAYRQSKQRSELDPRSKFKKNALLSRADLLRQYVEEAESLLQTVLTLFHQDAEAQLETPAKECIPQEQALPDHPYKFLDYFEEDDAAIFFGRTLEIRDVCADVLAHRLTILYAKSGTGKTSLIKAGVIPRLSREGHLAVYARPLQDDPLIEVKHAINKCLKQPIKITREATLQDFLNKVAERDRRPLVLILDQFEEFFIRFSSSVREAFIGQLARVHVSDLPVNLVLSMREDFLGELSEMETYIPSIFNSRFRLQPLTDKQAKEAVEGPVKLFGVSYEEELLDQMLADLSQEGVEPPQLQIVCHELWRQLQDEDKLISLEMYRQAGGTQQILAGYVTEALKVFAQDKERKVAKMILKEMVSSQQTKMLLDLEKLQEKLTARYAPEIVEQVLQRLINCRLVRNIERDDMLYYELAHEYLIATIRGWFDEEEVELKKAQEMLDRALADYAYSGSLLSRSHIKIVERYRNQLAWNTQADQLLQQSKMRSRRFSFGAGVLAVILLALLSFAGYNQYRIRQEEHRKLYDIGVFPEVVNPDQAELNLYRVQKGQPEKMEDFQGKEYELPAGDYYLEAVKDTWTLKYPVYAEGYGTVAKEIRVEIPEELSIPEDMAYIPASWFRRGDKEIAGNPNEKPPHDVYVREFLIDRHEVTNREYAEFVDAGGYQNQSFWTEEGWIWLNLHKKLDEASEQSFQARLQDSIESNADDEPIAVVSWYEASAYCSWADKELPTEAQWEKAARGPEGYRYAYGNTYQDFSKITLSETIKQPNSYGLYYMTGGVWEWVFDQYDQHYYYTLSQKPEGDRKNPRGPEETSVFKLSKHSLGNLKRAGMPEDMAQRLNPLMNREFTTTNELLEAVASHISPQFTAEYQTFIVGYALQEKSRVERGGSSLTDVVEDVNRTRTAFREYVQPSEYSRTRGNRGFRCVKNLNN